MDEAKLNEILHRAANQVCDLCGDDPDTILNACFGLAAHCVHSFGMTDAAALETFLHFLVQRPGGAT